MLTERQGPDRRIVHVWAMRLLLMHLALWIWMVAVVGLLIAPLGFALLLLLISVLIAAGTTYAWAYLYCNYYHWQFGDEQMHIWRGIFFRQRLTIPYMRIQNATVVQGPLLIMFGLSNIVVETAGTSPLQYGFSSRSGAYLPGVPDGERLADAIIEAAKRAKVREGL